MDGSRGNVATFVGPSVAPFSLQDSTPAGSDRVFSCHPRAMQCCGKTAVLHPLVLAWDWTMGSSQKELSVILDFTMIYGFAMVCPKGLPKIQKKIQSFINVHHLEKNANFGVEDTIGHCYFQTNGCRLRLRLYTAGRCGSSRREVSTIDLSQQHDMGFRVCWMLHRLTGKLHFQHSESIGILNLVPPGDTPVRSGWKMLETGGAIYVDFPWLVAWSLASSTCRTWTSSFKGWILLAFWTYLPCRRASNMC